MNFQENKNLIALAAAAVILGVGWGFLVPGIRAQDRLKVQLQDLESQVSELKALNAQKSSSASVKPLRGPGAEQGTRFPESEKESLRLIAELARKMNVDVISMQSQPRLEWQAKKGKGADILGRKIYRVPVSLNLAARYEDFVRYLETLKKLSASYVAFSKVNMKYKTVKDNTKPHHVDIKLDLDVFIALGTL